MLTRSHWPALHGAPLYRHVIRFRAGVVGVTGSAACADIAAIASDIAPLGHFARRSVNGTGNRYLTLSAADLPAIGIRDRDLAILDLPLVGRLRLHAYASTGFRLEVIAHSKAGPDLVPVAQIATWLSSRLERSVNLDTPRVDDVEAFVLVNAADLAAHVGPPMVIPDLPGHRDPVEVHRERHGSLFASWAAALPGPAHRIDFVVRAYRYGLAPSVPMKVEVRLRAAQPHAHFDWVRCARRVLAWTLRAYRGRFVSDLPAASAAGATHGWAGVPIAVHDLTRIDPSLLDLLRELGYRDGNGPAMVHSRASLVRALGRASNAVANTLEVAQRADLVEVHSCPRGGRGSPLAVRLTTRGALLVGTQVQHPNLIESDPLEPSECAMARGSGQQPPLTPEVPLPRWDRRAEQYPAREDDYGDIEDTDAAPAATAAPASPRGPSPCGQLRVATRIEHAGGRMRPLTLRDVPSPFGGLAADREDD